MKETRSITIPRINKVPQPGAISSLRLRKQICKRVVEENNRETFIDVGTLVKRPPSLIIDL